MTCINGKLQPRYERWPCATIFEDDIHLAPNFSLRVLETVGSIPPFDACPVIQPRKTLGFVSEMQDCTNCDSSLNDNDLLSMCCTTRHGQSRGKPNGERAFKLHQISIMLYQLYQFTWQPTIILHRLKEPIDLISSENASAVMDEGWQERSGRIL